MDLYAPVTNALAQTQSTIVDLMKVFMSNEIAKQNMELEREKLGQTSRGLDLEAQRNRLAITREQSVEDRARQEREDRIRQHAETMTFNREQAAQTATHQGNVFELNKAAANMGYKKQAADIAHQRKMEGFREKELGIRERHGDEELGFRKDEMGLKKKEFDQKFGETTIAAAGQRVGIDPYVWGFMGINKDAKTTPERFNALMSNPQTLASLPRAAIVRHAEQLKTMEAQILVEKDPAKKEQIKKNYDALYGQIRILQDYVEKGPPKELLTAIVKEMGITDEAEAAKAMENIAGKWKSVVSKYKDSDLSAARPSAKFDTAPPAATHEITTMLQDVKAGKYDLSPNQMQIIKRMTSNVTPQNTDRLRQSLANILNASKKKATLNPLDNTGEGPLSQPGMVYGP